MQDLKGVVFDFGCVLSEPQGSPDQYELATVLGIDSERFTQLYWHFRADYDAWIVDSHTYWRQVAGEAQVSINDEQVEALIEKDMESWTRPSYPVVRWVEALHDAGYKVGLLSNMSLEGKNYIANKRSWLPGFHHATYSCDINIVKPDAQIYEHCISGLGLPAQQLLFLDDKLENVEAARKVGMHAEVFTSVEILEDIVHRYDLPQVPN